MQLDADHNRANWAQLLTLRECLELAWNAGRAAHPDVTVDAARFEAHADPFEDAALGRHGADLYLAAGCLAATPRRSAASTTTPPPCRR